MMIDATMGNGNDTLKLCKKVADKGKVYAFDIQQCAIAPTPPADNLHGSKKVFMPNATSNIGI
jgi:16S rRNA C1402 N4-methylase RsmH